MKTQTNRLLKPVMASAIAILILLTPITSQAWGAGGHMIVAKIAYDRLNSHAKAAVAKLLAMSFNIKLPDGTTPKLSAKSQSLLASAFAGSRDFVNAAHWADDLRLIPELAAFKPLHFIDTPLLDDGTTRAAPKPNIVDAINDNLKILGSKSTDQTAKAQALRFIIHFVGDIHQPLHCVNRVGRDNSNGDAGGNLLPLFVFDVNGQLRKTSLHSYWDGGLGTFPPEGPNFTPPSISQILPVVAQAKKENPDDSAWQPTAPFNFQAWADESVRLAQSIAYTGVSNGSKINSTYRDIGARVARQRVALAGYRLAALLNAIWPQS